MTPSGNGHKKTLYFDHPPRRVVSLVPSLTESVFDLGFGPTVVGITDYCAHPAEALRDLPRLGGPKNPRTGEIIALQPDLVIANQEENTRQDVETLEAAGLKVWVTFPQTVRQALDVLWLLVGLFESRMAAIRLETLELTLEWAEASLEGRNPWRYFCPIWQEENGWMTFNHQTYANDVMRLVGGKNVFAERDWHTPPGPECDPRGSVDGEKTVIRYPRVTAGDVRTAAPDVIVLPDEPYAFDESHRKRLCEWLPDTPAVQRDRLHLVDGSLITWHGTRLARALRELPEVLNA
jgi:iron complex transport system substrate-binding protein